jgi:hypothetical protein
MLTIGLTHHVGPNKKLNKERQNPLDSRQYRAEAILVMSVKPAKQLDLGPDCSGMPLAGQGEQRRGWQGLKLDEPLRRTDLATIVRTASALDATSAAHSVISTSTPRA